MNGPGAWRGFGGNSPMNSMASLNQELMSALWLSSTGMLLYRYESSKWLGQLDETLMRAVIPNMSSMSFLEAWYALPRYRKGKISTGPP